MSACALLYFLDQAFALEPAEVATACKKEPIQTVSEPCSVRHRNKQASVRLENAAYFVQSGCNAREVLQGMMTDDKRKASVPKRQLGACPTQAQDPARGGRRSKISRIAIKAYDEEGETGIMKTSRAGTEVQHPPLLADSFE